MLTPKTGFTRDGILCRTFELRCSLNRHNETTQSTACQTHEGPRILSGRKVVVARAYRVVMRLRLLMVAVILSACPARRLGRGSCAAQLDAAWRELDIAKAEGFAGTC